MSTTSTIGQSATQGRTHVPLRLQSPRRPRQEPPSLPEPVQPQPPPELQTVNVLADDDEAVTLRRSASFVSAHSQEERDGGVRNAWATFGEMFQRRFLGPVMNVGRTVTMTTSSRGSSEQPQTLFSTEMQQAMSVHQSRASLISPQHHRQEEEASSSSVNQEMILEEVRRQVAMAMQGRDTEVMALRQKNLELEQALVEANTAMRAISSGATSGTQPRVQSGAQGLSGQPGAIPRGGPWQP